MVTGDCCFLTTSSQEFFLRFEILHSKYCAILVLCKVAIDTT